MYLTESYEFLQVLLKSAEIVQEPYNVVRQYSLIRILMSSWRPCIFSLYYYATKKNLRKSILNIEFSILSKEMFELVRKFHFDSNIGDNHSKIEVY